ncbi:hypothetical protein IGI04_002533 [Brassica rapa subsp. trilocularis]|uniref:Uncharacterized protein n=1 Tax=Brassica rapa subsp. trilocularis TaxID=1813537 RepID=A0ABQ7NXY4_BRACM|nr:hypothetical protein IGI04_002533 [Brassica rapa subsp. trilocularis]
METTIGAHRGAGDSSSPQDSSAVTEPTTQPDILISATTDHPGATSAQLAAMTISDHPANTSTLVATTSDKPSMVATSDHQANTSTQPSMVATLALPAAVTISHHPASTMSNTRTMYSTQPDISLIFQTLLGRIDELARGTTSRLDDLAHSQIICNNRINELQSVEIGAPRSQQVDITPRLQRVLFNDVPTPATGSGQHRSIQANDLHAPIASSGQQFQTHLGTENDKLEPRNELGTDELEPKAKLDPTNGKLVPSASRPHSFTNNEPEVTTGDEFGVTMNKLGASGGELRPAVGKLRTSGSELRATVGKLGPAVGKLGTSRGKLGPAVGKLGTSRGELRSAGHQEAPITGSEKQETSSVPPSTSSEPTLTGSEQQAASSAPPPTNSSQTSYG